MFKLLKSFFVKKKVEETGSVDEVQNYVDGIQTYIKYCVDKDGEIFIDIHLNDYSPESVTNLAKLVSSFTNVLMHVQTLETIKEGFFGVNQAEMYDLFVKKMIEEVASQENENEEEDQPCIKPSDML